MTLLSHPPRAHPSRRPLLGAAVLAAAVALVGCSSGKGVRVTDAPSRSPDLPESAKARLVLNVDGERQSTSASDWAAFRAEWEAAFKAAAAGKGTAFVWQDGPIRPLGEAGTLIAVHVLDYRYLPTAGASAGGPVGGPYVNAQMRYLGLADGRPYGGRNVNTAAIAARSPSLTSRQQIEAIAAEVMRDFRRE